MFLQLSLGYDSFSEFPCFWWPWKFGGTLVRYFVEWHSKMCYNTRLNRSLNVLITRLNRSYRFRGGRWKNKMSFSLHCFRVYTTNMTYQCDVDCDYLADIVFFKFSTEKLLFYLPLVSVFRKTEFKTIPICDYCKTYWN